MDPKTGKHWYLDGSRRVIVLDEASDYERDRQQLDPASEPAPDHPKYGPNIAVAEMPVAPGEIAPEVPTETAALTSTEKTLQGPPFLDEAAKKTAQEKLRAGLGKLGSIGVDVNRVAALIEGVNSPQAAEELEKRLEALSKARSPLRPRR